MKNYPRYIGHPAFKPFNPIKLAEETEKIVCDGTSRKYWDFRTYNHLWTSLTLIRSTDLHVVGCCLRCAFCWTDIKTRDFPEKESRFYTPREIVQIIEQRYEQPIRTPIKPRKIKTSFCLTGGEPTIGKAHLIKLLEEVEKSVIPTIDIETNGILFGANKSYVKEISEFPKARVRLGIKAGTPNGFQKITGSQGRFYSLPFQAIKHCLDYGVKIGMIAIMSDPRLMPDHEQEAILEKLAEYNIPIKEETIIPCLPSQFRLEKANIKIEFTSIEHQKAQDWQNGYIQI